MSGSGCHGDHLPGPAVSASPEQLRHQEILPGLCSWGQASCLAATLLSSDPSQTWGEDGIRSPHCAPAVNFTVLSHTRWWSLPSGTVTDAYMGDSFRGQGPAAEPRVPPCWSSLEKPHPSSQGSETGEVIRPAGSQRVLHKGCLISTPRLPAPQRRQGQSSCVHSGEVLAIVERYWRRSQASCP